MNLQALEYSDFVAELQVRRLPHQHLFRRSAGRRTARQVCRAGGGDAGCTSTQGVIATPTTEGTPFIRRSPRWIRLPPPTASLEEERDEVTPTASSNGPTGTIARPACGAYLDRPELELVGRSTSTGSERRGRRGDHAATPRRACGHPQHQRDYSPSTRTGHPHARLQRSLRDRTTPNIVALLRSGKNVITTARATTTPSPRPQSARHLSKPGRARRWCHPLRPSA